MIARTESAETGPLNRPSAWSVETVTEVKGFAQLRREWSALMERSAAGSFNRWEWLFPWHRRIAPERDLRILVAKDASGSVAGILPLAMESLRVAGRRVRRLSLLGETHVGSDFLEVVAARGEEAEVARTFAVHLRDTQAGWDLLDLLDVEDRSPTLENFAQELRHLVQVRKERFLCPTQRFSPGEGFEDYLSQTARKDNYLRRRKWLERQPGFQLRCSVGPEELAWPLAEFFRLHQMRWASDGGSQGIKGPSVEAFHRDATQLLAEAGMLRLYTLALGAQAVASVYGILDRGTFSYFQSGYDPAWASKSVGLVLVGETFRDALASGCYRYDFLRGTEGYKADWVREQRRTVSLRVFPPNGTGTLLHAQEQLETQLRGWAKAALPESAVEQLRRLRRKWSQI